ncbi:MAG: glycosyltransferase family 39 protein [Planctomycetes bacterium]|nr:glycosyltransferase family 39 protein [Planctomycetota bacterium]
MTPPSPPYEPPPAADLRPAATGRDERAGRLLLLLATVLLLITSLRNITGPWEHGLRGGVAARYTDVAVAVNLKYGLAVTHGLPGFVIEVDGKLEQNVNHHHPPYYWLYVSFWGWLLGHTPMALRIGQLLLFFPGLFALYLLVRRFASPQAAGWSALLFATAPLIAYYGPMVLQDGAVLGCGLWTLWRYQRLCDAPNVRNWLACAGLFFVSASWDFSGYWWGPAMFVLAFAQRRKLAAVLQVVGMFPVSLLAFGVMAWHFGFDPKIGSAVGYVHELLTLIHLESHGIAETVDLARFGEAMAVVWFEHFNIGLLVLALAGIAVAARDAALRPLLLVGAATLLPGLLNYGSMFRHAVDHPFWSVHGFAGLCVFAAAVPALGGRLRAPALVLACCVAIGGHLGTHRLVTNHEVIETNDTIAVMRKAVPLLDGVSTVMTSAPAVTQVQIEHMSMAYAIDTAEKLQGFVALGREKQFRDQVGFIVHPEHADPELVRVLDALSPRQVGPDGILVYRLSFAPQNDTVAVVEKAAPQLDGCVTVLTSAPPVAHPKIGKFELIYGVDDVTKLDELVAKVRRQQIRETFGFVLHPQHAPQDLKARLDSLAKGKAIDGGIFVYQLRLVE